MATQHVNEGTPLGADLESGEKLFLQPLLLISLDGDPVPRCVSNSCQYCNMEKMYYIASWYTFWTYIVLYIIKCLGESGSISES